MFNYFTTTTTTCSLNWKVIRRISTRRIRLICLTNDIDNKPEPKIGQYRLIIASNRDEFYSRKAKPLESTTSILSNVFGGQDMEEGLAGGMWLGVSTKDLENCKIRVGALLNVTGEERKTGSEGRGEIVKNYLDSDLTVDDYSKKLFATQKMYNAFNFITVELSDEKSRITHTSNAPKSSHNYEGTQLLGFGNSTVEKPLQKVVNGKTLFSEIVNEYNDTNQKSKLVLALLKFLKGETKHLPDEELKRRAPQTFEDLSSIFVKIDGGYGTRTHSIILIDRNWKMEFIESTMQEPIEADKPKWITTEIKSKL